MSVTWTDRYDKTHKDPFGKPITCSEWYKTHDSAKPFRDRLMKAINQLRYKGLHKVLINFCIFPDAEAIITRPTRDYTTVVEDRLYRFVCDVRKLSGMPVMTREMFDEGIRYRFPLARNYKFALEEMWLLCWGDW